MYYNTIQYDTTQYNTMQYDTNTIQYNTIHYTTIQYNTMRLPPLSLAEEGGGEPTLLAEDRARGGPWRLRAQPALILMKTAVALPTFQPQDSTMR